MSRTPLRWGILATGWIARRFTVDVLLAGLNVTAVGSRSAESAQEFAASFGIGRAHGSYSELVTDPNVDIVYVATPHPAHFDTAMAALEAGKHVLVEKPLTLNQAQAETLRETALSKGLYASEAMWTRYLPHMARIRQSITSGEIGEVRTLHADHAQSLSTNPSHRINALELGGGALLDLGVYPVSFAWDILGTPVTVQAAGRLGQTGADTEVGVLMTHSSGAISTCLASARGAGSNTASIVGTEGRIDIDRMWFTPAGFTRYDAEGQMVEKYVSDVSGHGMQLQALAAEEYVAAGNLSGELMTLDDSVAIMGTLDEIRRQIGVHYPEESPPASTTSR